MIVLICARSGSQRVKNKNLKEMLGLSLIELAIECGRALNPNRVYISTDYDCVNTEIDRNVIKLDRPKHLCGSSVPEKSVWDFHLDQLLKSGEIDDYEIICVLPPTSPFRKLVDINNALNMLNTRSFDMVVSAVAAKKSIDFNVVAKKTDGSLKAISKQFGKFSRSQDVTKYFELTTCFYLFRAPYLKAVNNIYEGNVGIFPVEEISGIDIDTPLDLEFAQFIAPKVLPSLDWWGRES